MLNAYIEVLSSRLKKIHFLSGKHCTSISYCKSLPQRIHLPAMALEVPA